MTTKSLIITLAAAMLSLQANASCPNGYDETRASADGSACVGILQPENAKASDPIDGDLMFIKGGNARRVAGVPREFTPLSNGVLFAYDAGSSSEIAYWDASSGQTQVCHRGINNRELARKAITIETSGDFIRVKGASQSKSYFAGCEDSGSQAVFADLTAADHNTLKQYSGSSRSNNLTDPQVNATLPEILGRDDIVESLISTLSSNSIRSTLLWGPPGVGKTAIAYRLATKIVRGEVPNELRDWSVYLIDIGTLGEEGVKGRTEQKVSDLIKASAGKKVVLVIDEIHQLVGLGASGEDKSDATELFKTTLANGELAIIGTSTDQESELSLLRTKTAFYQRFAKQHVDEPNDEVLGIIYRHHAGKALRQNNVQISDRLVGRLIRLVRRYVPTEAQPRIGIKMIEAVAAAKSAPRGTTYEATSQDIKNAIGKYANLPNIVTEVDANGQSSGPTFKQQVQAFPENVRKKFVGQDAAIDAVYNNLVRYAAGNQHAGRPAGVFLFLGPSGVGKTYLTELFADMFDKPYKSWPMAQFKEEHSASTFNGSPPGYVGYSADGGALARWINNNPSGVLNFDEIDKAHGSIFETLMNIMDNGKFTDAAGVDANFTNGFMFFTSNFALDLIAAYDKKVLGIVDPDAGQYSKPYEGYIPTNERELKQEILNKLTSEGGAFGTFIAGRVGESRIVVFHHLDPREAQIIAGFEVKKVVRQLRQEYNVTVDEAVIQYIASQSYSFKFGARKARDNAENFVASPVSEALLNVEDPEDVKEIRVRLVDAVDENGKSIKKVKVDVIQ